MTPAPRQAEHGPAATAAAMLAALLARHGLTRTYTAARPGIAVISITPGLTAWTNGRTVWTGTGGHRQTWAATDTQSAAARLAALARPGPALAPGPGSSLSRSGSE